MKNKKQIKKSVGVLFPHTKTKDDSPDMTGKLTLQRSFVMYLAKTLQESGADEIQCNGALWSYFKPGKRYVSFEISPYYPSKPKEPVNDNSVDQFFKEITKQTDSDEEEKEDEHTDNEA